SALADGTLRASVVLTDSAGNTGASSVATTWKDATPPAVPTLALDARDDSGASSSDYVTSVRAPRFLVAGEAGAGLTVYVNGAVYAGQSLADGTYTVTATATDAAGNVSAVATAPLRLVVDTTGATGSIAVAGAKVANGVPTVTSRTLTLLLSITSGLAALVELAVSVDGGATFGAATAYSATAAATLPAADGLYTVTVRVVDLAGNVAVITQSVRLDTAGPAISASLTPPGASGSYDLGAPVSLTTGAADVSGIS